ncbi:hypothetical protein GGR58DRAFT_453112 [Xylaria digitata]|nr:hypothetical protein GGR58DRAFT_453112 [Xylaria digitata]
MQSLTKVVLGPAHRQVAIMDTPTPPKNILFWLPYELLLDVFCELPDPSSVNALASTHPILATVCRDNKDSIQKAVRYNYMAEFPRKVAGSASMNLMRIASAFYRISELGHKSLSHYSVPDYFSKSWVVSDWDMARLKKRKAEDGIRDCAKAACELEHLNFFVEAPNLDSWYNEIYKSEARKERLKQGPEQDNATYTIPSTVSHTEVLMAVELWVTLALHYSSIRAPAFLRIFAPKFSAKVVQFAQRYIRGKKK